MRGLSRRDILLDASPRGIDCSVASMGTEASCNGGTIEEVEVDIVLDWIMTGCHSVPEDPLPGGADNDSTEASERASYGVIVMSNIPALCGE